MTANAIDLCLVSDVKAWLNITQVDATNDALIQRLITGASDFIEQYLSRDIVVTTYTSERYNGPGGSTLMLANWPIVAVTAITVTDQSGTVLSTFAASDCWFDDRTVYLNNGNVFTKGLGNVTVTYQAGYASIPFGLTQACIELVAHRYRERDRIGLASKGMAGETTAYVVTDMPKSTRAYLDQIKNVVPA